MRISVRPAQTTVKNQGDRPTCVAFAVTALHEHVHDIVSGSKSSAEIDLSEEFLYYHCKKRDNLQSNSGGTTVSAASASLRAEGQSLEVLCPYQAQPPSNGSVVPPAPEALADGKTRPLSGLRPLVPTVYSIRSSLRWALPVVAVVDLYSNAYFAPAGRIRMPKPSDRRLGRHAVLVVGIREQIEVASCTITFKNSWGQKWGDQGFGSFGLDYFKANCREIWGISH